MEKVEKKEKNNKESKYEYVKISKTKAIAETNKGVMILVENNDKQYTFWCSKNHLKNNDYILFMSLSINLEATYELTEEGSGDLYKIKGSDLVSFFKQ